ncbi:MAG: rhodanese family protein [Pseudomonadota bacterium]|nr:rhodanese family protein [Pseudomonadota bacterium]
MTNTINVTDAANKIKAGEAILIDVREPDEFKAEHIAYALSVPLSSLEGGFQMLEIPSDKTILFQCLKGSRGQMACQRIQGMDSCKNNVMNIEGGIEAWKAAGLPVIGASVTKKTAKISIMRQVQMIVGFLIAFCVLMGFTGMTFAFILAGVFGAALCFAGLSGWCGLAILLSKMPWNK